MINNLKQKDYLQQQVNNYEKALLSLREQLLPDREQQYLIMAKGYVNKIRELREEIDEFIGLMNFDVPKKDFNIHLEGPSIGYGRIPISIVTQYLANFKKTFQRIYALLENIQYKTNPPKSVINVCDFDLLALDRGSAILSMELPNLQLMFDNCNISYKLEKTINSYFNVLNWSVNSNVGLDLGKNIKEEVLISTIKTFPDNKNIDRITFSGRFIEKPKIIITKKERDNVIKYLTRTKSSEELITYRGHIREIDLDKNTFTLRNVEGNEEINNMRCALTGEIAEQLREYLDAYVEVTGIRIKRSSILNVKYIENIEDKL